MSGFQLPKDAREFFRHVEKRSDGRAHLDLMFDQYYFCLMLGIDGGNLGDGNDLESNHFIDHYPNEYQPQASIIAGLIINAELSRKSIEKDDRASIEQEMLILLDHRSRTRLSDAGLMIANRYAVAGLQSLRTHLDPPASLEEFLVTYHRLWNRSDS